MNVNDAFPLHSVPGRIRTAILYQFQGRCPTAHEVAQLSDKQWLTVPGIGPSALGIIRSVTVVQPATNEAPISTSMTEDELLDRLTSIQEELRCIRNVLKAKMGATSISGTRLLTEHRIGYYAAAAHEFRV